MESSLRRGIGRYVMNLLKAMIRLAPQHRYVLLGEKVPWQVPHLSAFIGERSVRYETFWNTYSRELDVLLLTDPVPMATGRPLFAYPVDDLPCATIFYDLIPLAFREIYLEPDPLMDLEYTEHLRQMRQSVSKILTISEYVAQDIQRRLEIESDRVIPILGGLDEVFSKPANDEEIAEARQKYDIHHPYFFYTGGTDYRKNIPVLLEAFARVRRQSNTDVKLVLAGEFNPKWKTELQAHTQLNDVVANLILPGYVTDDELRGLYGGAVAFVFPSLYEGFGLPALEAMACGCPVIVSNGTSLKEIVGDAGLLVDPESAASIVAAMQSLLNSPDRIIELRQRGLRQAKLYTWDDVAAKTLNVLIDIARPKPKAVAPTRRMRVLVQNREDAFYAPGGDTVIMEQLYRTLRNRDVDVQFAAGAVDLSQTDLVHLVNLTVGRVTNQVSENARSQNVPYIITTLFEDWPLYMERSFAALNLFKKYLEQGKSEREFRQGLQNLRIIRDGVRVGNDQAAQQAALLLACGESEAKRLIVAYPGVEERTRIVKFGIPEPKPLFDHAFQAVEKMLGFDRYVLCCGRLETRKNQLMLLKALEDSELPVVFAGGGYQPEYARLAMSYPRKGPVKTYGRLDPVLFRHLMARASVHVLPSWYELPGLVTLEAASAGTAVVASDWGAIRDYMPEGTVHFCQPDDPDSIRDAVEAALKAGPNPAAKAIAESHTWQDFADATLEAYEAVLSRKLRSNHHSIHSTESTNNKIESIGERAMQTLEKARSRFTASIIIPVHNQSHLTMQCLNSLSNAADTTSYEVIIVDNHSTDDTPQVLKAVEGDVMVLRQSENRGFAAACNIGARLANGEYLVFLNNDTEVHSGWLDAMVKCARDDGAIGAVGAKLLYPSGDIQHAGLAVSVKRVPYHVFQRFQGDHPAVNETRDMQAVTAACMLVPKDVFDANGGFDEGYRNGFEDVDFCLRLRQNGHRIVYCPDAVVTHFEESTAGRKDHDRENLERFMEIWGDSLELDETELLARHGYTIVWGPTGGKYQTIERTTPATRESQKQLEVGEVTIENARQRYQSGDVENAALILKTIVEQRMTLAGQDSFEAWQMLGNCLTRLSQYDDAEQAYHKAIEYDGQSERPYLGLGALAMLQENWQAAMYGFMTALAKNPHTMRGEFGVGLSMAARKMHEQAITRFSKVLEQEPENSEALFYLYRSAMESGNPRVAIKPLQKYLEKHPDDTDFLFNLCGAYWKSGEIVRAAELCQSVLDKDPSHEAAKDVLKHLEDMLTEHA
ncbi:MAG: glycosyltransferase [Calditrichota bacterium]